MENKQLVTADDFITPSNSDPMAKPPAYIKGFSLDRSKVMALSNKWATILGWQYKSLPEIGNPGALKEKLILAIELQENKQRVDYFINKTAQRTVIAKVGDDLNKWVGVQIELFINAKGFVDIRDIK